MRYNKSPTREVLGGDIVLVGEDHRSPVYRRIARKIIGNHGIGTAAIERGRPRVGGKCAIGVVGRHADEVGIPLVAVDTPPADLFPDGANTSGLYDVVNRTDVDRHTGWWNEDTKWESRDEAIERFGDWVSDAVWETRELHMAERLLNIHQRPEFDAPIIMATGIYHLDELAERLEDPDHSQRSVPDGRILR